MTSETNEQHFDVLWPGGPSAVPTVPAAGRLDTLDGKRIGFLWDRMFRGEEIFPYLEQQIRARFPKVEFVGYDAFGSTFGGDEDVVLEALPARLRELRIHGVISGNGC